jgi:serine/threonine protein phosphatase PrpC
VRVSAATASDRGRVRDGNEDRVFVDVPGGIFAVVDGVGGHAAGEVAATIAVEVIAQRLARPLWSPAQRVREAIALANNEILAQASASPERAGMTCVLTLALLTERRLTIGHVGDTRLYVLDAGGMRKLTHDHSPIGEREDAGELTESEAMRHPRRNEVFRDVGSVYHEPDDPDFVELIEEPFDDGKALLLCSDGLSDMVSAPAIERIVRLHAGDPARVAEALILAANEAGGRDNVSVVYAEGSVFARRLASASSSEPAAPPILAASPARHTHPLMTRGAWLVAGLLAGLGLGLVLAWMLTLDDPVTLAPRTLLVDRGGGAEYTTIAAAMAAALPGDTLELAPGEYDETVVVADGVNLRARQPGSVVLVARPETPGWMALHAGGRLGSRISGITVRGEPARPMAIGVRLAGDGLHLTEVGVSGNVDIGIEVDGDGVTSIRSTRFSAVTGTPVRVANGSRPLVENNVFVRSSGGRGPAIEAAADSVPDIRDNVFIGYAEPVKSEAVRALPAGNLSVPAPAGTARRNR